MEIKGIDEMVKDLLDEALEFKKLGDHSMAQELLLLAVHTERLRMRPLSRNIPDDCSLI